MSALPSTLKEALSLARRSGPRALADALSERVRQVDGKINAYVHFDPAKIELGEKAGPLQGVPVSIKDNISTRGWETT